jgi:hypothetical protein
MTTSNTIINTIIASALIFGATAPASAEIVFPPAHLSSDAVFERGTVSDETIGNAWYHQNESERRANLTVQETQESSPYPSTYYFVKIRDHANDESARLNKYRSNSRNTEIKIADKARVADDQS